MDLAPDLRLADLRDDRGRDQRGDEAGIGRHGLRRVAVREDEPDVGVGLDDRLEVELVMGRLEEPAVRGATRLQQASDPRVIGEGLAHVAAAPPGVIAPDRHRHLLGPELEAEDLGVLHRGVDLPVVHRRLLRLLAQHRLDPVAIGDAPRVGRFVLDPRRRAGILLLPGPQRAKLRIERHHVAERGRAGPRQSDDRDGTIDRGALRLGMELEPGLDLEPVDQPPRDEVDRALSVLGPVGHVGRQALEQDLEPLEKAGRPEVLESALARRPLHQLRGRGICVAHAPYSVSRSLSHSTLRRSAASGPSASTLGPISSMSKRPE